MKRTALLILAVCFVISVSGTSALALWKKYVDYPKFSPSPEQEAVLSVVEAFKKTNNDADKNSHFALFAEDAVIVVTAGQRYYNEMTGREEIIEKTPWTGTKVRYTKIWFGKMENGRAELSTKVSLSSGKRATYNWTLVRVQESWKIGKLVMKV